MNNNASYTLKTLLKAKQWCTASIDRKIVNGEHIDIWLDPWIKGYSLVDKYGWSTMAVFGENNRKVSTPIFGNEWKNHMCLLKFKTRCTI